MNIERSESFCGFSLLVSCLWWPSVTMRERQRGREMRRQGDCTFRWSDSCLRQVCILQVFFYSEELPLSYVQASIDIAEQL